MQKNNHNPENSYNGWQKELAEAFTNITDLCQFLQLSVTDLPVSIQAAKDFPLKVPLSFVSCMEKGNPDDPLLRQVLPVWDEQLNYPGFSSDPVGDLNAVSASGVLHKYFARVLLIVTGSCAINCRYCFRRSFPYGDNQLSKQKESSAMAYLNNHSEISEVILSGGDPLLLSNQRLAELIEKIDNIAHIRRIRIHSRIPVVLPGRINGGLLEIFKRSEKKLILVIHCNHANEISPQVVSACSRIKQNNITLLNQAVLLKGVNDNTAQLCQLSERLFSAGVLPYYLHLLDKACGTGHFEVSEAEAIKIMQQLQEKLPGYLVPKLVKEQAGALSKLHVV